jgi:Papain family cysteine protease
MSKKLIAAGGKTRVLNVRPDAPDLRDRPYEPALVQLATELDNSNPNFILDQGQEGACTGFGAAAVINLLKDRQGFGQPVSARMLYEMAQKHDEWPGEDYDGSSCRGAIRGWKNMGVCDDSFWKYSEVNPGVLTIARAKNARSTILGAYYRLRPNLNDYHAAINETGALYVSATVHEGWNDPQRARGSAHALIVQSDNITGGHAFAIVGYNDVGFIVQNSWGKTWGSKGFAIWTYEDWANNVSDGWVFRLAVPTPKVFGLTARSDVTDVAQIGRKAPKRIDIAGHFAHFDDGCLKNSGDYWSNLDDLQLTIDKIRDLAVRGEIQHLLIYAHGGLNNPKASASRIAAMKNGFKRNGIYPFHMMYDTGLGEELGDILRKAFSRSEGLLDQWKDKLQDASDKVIEGVVKAPGTAFWKEMKSGATTPFGTSQSDGVKVVSGLLDALDGTGVKVHLVGHSTGGILLGRMIEGLDLVKPATISSCSLLAPACTIDFYKSVYVPRLKKTVGLSIVQALDLYNLSDELENDDHVAGVYRKSLLYLVSRAFEETRKKPLLGMALYSKNLRTKNLKKIISLGKGVVTRSTSHGGFDNDAYTMNSVLSRVLKGKPKMPFTKDELNY